MSRRVAQILGTSTGGIGTHVASLTRGLLERGDRVTVLGPADTDARFGFRAAGARFVPVDIPSRTNDPLADGRALLALRKAVRGPFAGAPDIIHAHGLHAGLLARAAKTADVPLVVTWHNHLRPAESGFTARALRQAERLVARGARVCLCTDPEQVSGIFALGAHDVRYAPVAAPPLPEPGANTAAVKESLGATDRPLILAVGRLHPVKRFDVLIAAAARWTKLDPAPLVVIAGDGPNRSELEDLVAATGANVKLLGHRTDIADLLAAADLAAVTSVSETRQLFAQQALRSATPLVATRAGGIPALVGNAALLVPTGDVDAVDTAVRSLLSDAGQREKLAAAGAERAAGWPTEADGRDQADALYRELTGR